MFAVAKPKVFIVSALARGTAHGQVTQWRGAKMDDALHIDAQRALHY